MQFIRKTVIMHTLTRMGKTTNTHLNLLWHNYEQSYLQCGWRSINVIIAHLSSMWDENYNTAGMSLKLQKCVVNTTDVSHHTNN